MYKKADVLFSRLVKHNGSMEDTTLPDYRRDPLHDPKIGNVQEREIELVVLADGHQRRGGIDAL